MAKKKEKETVAKVRKEKGVETMLRSAYRTQLDLTNLADTKSNILISINGLILSVLLAAGGFIANLESMLLVPVGALFLTSIGAMFFAVHAARPRLPDREVRQVKDFLNGDANVLFFQDFASLTENSYVEVMDHVIQNSDLTYQQMSRHLYSLGVGLNRKYGLLRIAYGTFIFGILGSALLFLLVFFLFIHPVGAAPKMDFNQTSRFSPLEGVFEPSAVQQLSDGRFLLAEDEKEHPFDLLTPGKDGDFQVESLSPEDQFEKGGPGDGFRKLDDLEALDVDRDGRVIAITSHSLTGKGKSKQSREKLIRFRIIGNRMQEPGIVYDLRSHLMDAIPALKEAGEARDVKNGNGLNIEGMALDPSGKQLLIGFRGPLVDGKAMIAIIENADTVFEKGVSPRIRRNPVLLDLKGQGIRGMARVSRLNGFLILSGPREKTHAESFGLWFWNGQTGVSPERVTVSGLQSLEHAEGITPFNSGNREGILIVSDDGDRSSGKPAQYLILGYDQLKIAGKDK